MLPPLQACATPRDLTISGTHTIAIPDVVVGDVWLCSGQSNMEMTLGHCDAPEDIAAATGLRF